jgi:hypothetical protein
VNEHFSQAPERHDWQEFKPAFVDGKIKICDKLRAVTPWAAEVNGDTGFRSIWLRLATRLLELVHDYRPIRVIRTLGALVLGSMVTLSPVAAFCRLTDACVPAVPLALEHAANASEQITGTMIVEG